MPTPQMFATHAAAVAFLSALKHRLEGGSSWPDAIGHVGAAEGRTVNDVRIEAGRTHEVVDVGDDAFDHHWGVLVLDRLGQFSQRCDH